MTQDILYTRTSVLRALDFAAKHPPDSVHAAIRMLQHPAGGQYVQDGFVMLPRTVEEAKAMVLLGESFIESTRP